MPARMAMIAITTSSSIKVNARAWEFCGMRGFIRCGVVWADPMLLQRVKSTQCQPFTTELWALVLLQTLHAGSFAACHLGAMAFMQRALPASGVALGQSVYYAIGTGAAQAVIFQLAGLLYGQFGQKAFLGMFVVAAIGATALALLARRWKGEVLVGA